MSHCFMAMVINCLCSKLLFWSTTYTIYTDLWTSLLINHLDKYTWQASKIEYSNCLESYPTINIRSPASVLAFLLGWSTYFCSTLISERDHHPLHLHFLKYTTLVHFCMSIQLKSLVAFEDNAFKVIWDPTIFLNC